MTSKAKTVEEYLKGLPEDRRKAISAVREVMLKNLDKEFGEGILYGMIGYFVPHSIYPAGYHCDPSQPLCFAMLGSQKNYMSLYLMSVYGSESVKKQFVADWKKTGKKLDMGQACVRFKSADDLALDVIAKTIKGVKAREYAAGVAKFLVDHKAKRKAAAKARPKAKVGPKARTKPRVKARAK